MKSYLRTTDFISEDINARLKTLKDGEKLMIEIEKDCLDDTYIYSHKNNQA